MTVSLLSQPRRRLSPARVAGATAETVLGSWLIWGVLGFGLFILIMSQNGVKPDKTFYFVW